MHTNFQNRGFTLIETMVAISIITLAVVGPLTAASTAITAAQTARDRLTASYLAQEGIEYVRRMRDDSFLMAYQVGGPNVSTIAWNNFIDGSIKACRTSTCTLDPSRGMGIGSGFSLNTCSRASCAPLYIANNIYTLQSDITGAVATPFVRTIRAVDVSSSDEQIISTVTWIYHSTSYSVTVYDHLTSWQ